jgi:hypothetical protein
METLEIIQLAQHHLNNGAVMATSALVCCEDAMAQYVLGHDATARMWARKSLSYSVGIFHPDYQAVEVTLQG